MDDLKRLQVKYSARKRLLDMLKDFSIRLQQ